MTANKSVGICLQCPRHCGVQRSAGIVGYCRMPETVYVSRIAPHFGEEPPISGTRGSGTVFFTGCNLHCVFCQNRQISHVQGNHPCGTPLTEDSLADRLLKLADSGVHNLNLVTPTHYTETVARVLTHIKPHVHIPIVWNSSGYESPDSLRRLDGLIDIYMPDFKYASSMLAGILSGAPDYPDIAAAALMEMFRQVGAVRFSGGGSLLQRGMIVRHLVLPGCRQDSIAVIRRLAGLLPLSGIRVSLMSQYTPDFLDTAFALPEDIQADLEKQGIRPTLRRRLTEFEYRSVLDEADRLGAIGYRQERASAQATYTPDFGKGIL